MTFHPIPRFGRFRHRRPPLRRQLFTWLALTILMTGISVAMVFHLSHFDRQLPFDVRRLERFVGDRFGERWQDPAALGALSQSLGLAIDADIQISAADGSVRATSGASCTEPDYAVGVVHGGAELGKLGFCFHQRPRRFTGLIALATACLVLWAAASALARRLTRPLSSLIAVTRDIGAGNLKSRVRLRRSLRGELGALAEAINDMAERIERQLNEQRELLAAVSHEVRSPLARLRISSELLRSNPGHERALDAIENEVLEIDNLVGKLLASSRLDFGSLVKQPLDAAALGRSVCERRNLSVDKLHDQSDGARFAGDPTLVARALENLLDNAEQHGGGLAHIVVRRANTDEHPLAPNAVVFEVEDRGRGFSEETRRRAFEAFFRAPRPDGEAGTSLGLGLSLVERIARAHGGRAWAHNAAGGGARVGFSVG